MLLLSFILFIYNFVKEHNLVDKVGVEPTTSRVSDVCTNQLCYLSIMVAGRRFELLNHSVKDCCVTTSPPSKKGQEGWSCTNSISICPPEKYGGGGGSRTHYLLGMSQSCKLLHFTAIRTPCGEPLGKVDSVLSGGSIKTNVSHQPI